MPSHLSGTEKKHNAGSSRSSLKEMETEDAFMEQRQEDESRGAAADSQGEMNQQPRGHEGCMESTF